MRSLWERFNAMMQEPPTTFGAVMWVTIGLLLALIVFILAIHAGQSV